jgi:hypothetical protein
MKVTTEKPILLTHNMIRLRGKKEAWKCVDCGRMGTIRGINSIPCPKAKR